ncbi:hypothetical protein QA601_00830 [Chitinispirillales bacterium ANBcel5]|uniref:hypothetical protein n=1 Tax=Cellulosispirillum alkaliphilum TaxID=3039283 RepID=UPI002A52FC49|nr:hypothetical protein [Chitinispirillales bacterium ANBcel5]
MGLLNKRHIMVVMILLFSTISAVGQGTVKRGRNEGTANIPASNVLGSGNVNVYTSFIGDLVSEGVSSNVSAGASIGVAEMLQLSFSASLADLSRIGPFESTLQVTLPGNDRFKIFGTALLLQLFLSTEADTLGESARADKPDFHSFIRPAVIFDLDWFALNKSLPLKNYLMFSFVENQNILHLYNQAVISAGIEWKGYKNSFFVDGRYSIYKERRIRGFHGDRGYKQSLLWIEPGCRLRIAKNLRITVSARLLLRENLKQETLIPVTYNRLAVEVEIPLLFRKTNTETIRSLIFKEKRKKEKENEVEKILKEQQHIEAMLRDIVIDLPKEDDHEGEIRKKRKEIMLKMEEIKEKLQILD